MLGQWIPLDSDRFYQPRPEMIRGVELKVFLTPYDIPDAVRATMDRASGWFHVDFMYLGKESPDEALEDDGDEDVRLRVGRHSGRLYRVSVHVCKLRVPGVALNILAPVQKAIRELAKDKRRSRRIGNYDVAQEVLSERQKELFEDLIPA